MRVLHVATFNIAGVPGLLVNGLRQKGTEADLIVTLRHPYGFPYETIVEGGGTKFLRRIMSISQGYDIVHVHGLLYRFCVDIFALKMLKRRVIMHFHGSELRQGHNLLSVRLAQRASDRILVSTPDLLSFAALADWLPNPIDPIFRVLRTQVRKGRALYFRKEYEADKEKLVKDKCDEMGLELTIPNGFIPYCEMPYFLNQFEVFFDRFVIPSLSKTALEALACGCKVISWNGPILNPRKIIRQHELDFVVKKLTQKYEEILN